MARATHVCTIAHVARRIGEDLELLGEATTLSLPPAAPPGTASPTIPPRVAFITSVSYTHLTLPTI